MRLFVTYINNILYELFHDEYKISFLLVILVRSYRVTLIHEKSLLRRYRRYDIPNMYDMYVHNYIRAKL